jgi:hypothetical protein
MKTSAWLITATTFIRAASAANTLAKSFSPSATVE